MPLFTPDDIMDQTALPDGPIVIYDDDQIYIAGVVAQQLAAAGHDVHFVTPAAIVSPWTEMTLEQDRIQRALITAGVSIHTGRSLAEITGDGCRLDCVYGGVEAKVLCGAIVLVTERTRQTELYDELVMRGSFAHLELIGDAASPGLIADAVFDGHRAARGFEGDQAEQDAAYFRREIVSLNDTAGTEQ
jgi:dimethylamine/trimethylamine dehydrogenase